MASYKVVMTKDAEADLEDTITILPLPTTTA